MGSFVFQWAHTPIDTPIKNPPLTQEFHDDTYYIKISAYPERKDSIFVRKIRFGRNGQKIESSVDFNVIPSFWGTIGIAFWWGQTDPTKFSGWARASVLATLPGGVLSTVKAPTLQNDGYIGFGEIFSGGKFEGYDFIEDTFWDAWEDIDEAFLALHLTEDTPEKSSFPYKVISLDISGLHRSLASSPLPVQLEFFKFIPARSAVRVQYILDNNVRKEESPENILCKNVLQESGQKVLMTCTLVIPAERLYNAKVINFWYE